MEFLNDDLDVLDIIENGIPRRIYDRSNYFEDMDNITFFKRFRLRKRTVLQVLPQIEDFLEFDEDVNNSVTPINQLLTTLRFYATGAHLSSVADFMGMHVATASRIVKKTSEAIASISNQYIMMPHHEEVIQVQNRFFQMASFPRVIGCVDGTHIKIQSPGGADGEIFRNRKGHFSLNVQVVGDSNLKVRDIVCRWPGSQHDQSIFQHSRIRTRFEMGEFQNSILLGDSGYALRNYILTPLLNPRTRQEILYNEAHIRTRNSIERLFGVMKRRFPVLAYGIRLKLNTTLAVVVAAAVLHNIARDMNEDEPPGELNEEELNYLIAVGDIPELLDDRVNNNLHGIYRDELINNYFINL